MIVGDRSSELLELLVRRCKSAQPISRFKRGVACFRRLLVDDCVGLLVVATLIGGVGGEEAACGDCDGDDLDEDDLEENVLLQSLPCTCSNFSHSSLCFRSCVTFSSYDVCDFSSCSICCKMKEDYNSSWWITRFDQAILMPNPKCYSEVFY